MKFQDFTICFLIYLGLIFNSFGLKAQPGFFKIYPMDVVGSSFNSIQTIDNKLYVYGTAIDTSIANNWGVHLIEVDTFGQINNKLFYTDVYGDNMVVNGIVVGGLLDKTSNGNLFCTGTFWGSGRNLYALKADTSLSWFQLYEHIDSTIAFDNPYHISSYNEGFLISGVRRKHGMTERHGFVTQFNDTLEEVWNYFNPISQTRSIFLGSFGLGNKFYVGGSVTYLDGMSNTTERKSVIYEFDQEGSVVNYWQPEDEEEIAMLVFNSAPDGGFIYSSRDVIYHNNNTFSQFPRLVRRDSTYQKLWEVELPVSGSDQNRVMGITRSLDGQWLVSAKLYTELAGSPGNPRMAPCVFKISDAGEILWSTCVTFPYEWVNTQFPSFWVGNVIQISTGSMYMVGSVNRSNPSRTLGWMLKLDADGCLYENPCHPEEDTTSVTVLSTTGNHELQIYPNPAGTTVQVHAPEPGRLYVYDLSGRRVLDQGQATEGINTMSIASLPTGIYIMVLYGESGHLYRGRLGVVE